MLELWQRYFQPSREPRVPRTLAEGDPRLETVEAAARRLHHLERSADAVYRKIVRSFDNDFQPTASQQEVIRRGSKTVAGIWTHYYAAESQLDRDPQQRASLAEAMQRAASDYLGAFALLSALDASPRTNPGYASYGKNHAADYLYQTYVNHLTNAAEARFIACGVDALIAHRLNGLAIRHCIDIAKEDITEAAYVSPPQLRPRSEIEALNQIERLRHYWKSSAAGVGWQPPERGR